MKDVKNKNAVVTGAASGIGLGIAEVFSEAGMNLVLADSDHEKLKQAVSGLKQKGKKVIGVETDVSDPKQVEVLAARAVDEFGEVHVLCNNAGVAYSEGSSWNEPLDLWKGTIAVNLMGVVHGIRAFVPIMLAQNCEGHIVNTSSGAGLFSSGINCSYAVSKHGVVTLTETLYLELKNIGARLGVSLLCPGPVNTSIMETSKKNIPNFIPRENTEEEKILIEALKRWFQRSLAPKEVGQMVLDAILKDTFYIITHDYMKINIETRMKNILAGKNPEYINTEEDIKEDINRVLLGMGK